MRITYDDILEDSGSEARSREATLLDRSIELMRRADAAGPLSPERHEAVRFVERLWTRLVEDLGSPRNRLEPALRADLISIGIFILRELVAIGRGERDFTTVSEITEHVRAGVAA